jgi:hypothetical protein
MISQREMELVMEAKLNELRRVTIPVAERRMACERELRTRTPIGMLRRHGAVDRLIRQLAWAGEWVRGRDTTTPLPGA